MKLRDQERPPSDPVAGDGLPENVVSISPEALEESVFSVVPPVKKSQQPVLGKMLRFPKATDPNARRNSARKKKVSTGGLGTRKKDALTDARPEAGPHSGDVAHTPRASLLERVHTLISTVEEKLIAGDAKPTVADWIRLIEIERELMTASGPRQIRVTWVTPNESDVKKIFGPRKRGPEGGQDAA